MYLTCNGDVPDSWTVTFVSGEDGQRSVTFPGDNITISDLTAGAEYTFTLSASDGETLTGMTQIVYTMPEANE